MWFISYFHNVKLQSPFIRVHNFDEKALTVSRWQLLQFVNLVYNKIIHEVNSLFINIIQNLKANYSKNSIKHRSHSFFIKSEWSLLFPICFNLVYINFIWSTCTPLHIVFRYSPLVFIFRRIIILKHFLKALIHHSNSIITRGVLHDENTIGQHHEDVLPFHLLDLGARKEIEAVSQVLFVHLYQLCGEYHCGCEMDISIVSNTFYSVMAEHYDDEGCKTQHIDTDALVPLQAAGEASEHHEYQPRGERLVDIEVLRVLR